MDYALSREGPLNKAGGKMYIQDKVEEYSDEVFDALDKGAHIYFCGLKGMMPGIQVCPSTFNLTLDTDRRINPKHPKSKIQPLDSPVQPPLSSLTPQLTLHLVSTQPTPTSEPRLAGSPAPTQPPILTPGSRASPLTELVCTPVVQHDVRFVRRSCPIRTNALVPEVPGCICYSGVGTGVPRS